MTVEVEVGDMLADKVQRPAVPDASATLGVVDSCEDGVAKIAWGGGRRLSGWPADKAKLADAGLHVIGRIEPRRPRPLTAPSISPDPLWEAVALVEGTLREVRAELDRGSDDQRLEWVADDLEQAHARLELTAAQLRRLATTQD